MVSLRRSYRVISAFALFAGQGQTRRVQLTADRSQTSSNLKFEQASKWVESKLDDMSTVASFVEVNQVQASMFSPQRASRIAKANFFPVLGASGDSLRDKKLAGNIVFPESSRRAAGQIDNIGKPHALDKDVFSEHGITWFGTLLNNHKILLSGGILMLASALIVLVRIMFSRCDLRCEDQRTTMRQRVGVRMAAQNDDKTDARGGLRLLEWIPSQKLLVSFARFFWTTLWRVMLSELAPQSPEGAYIRPAPQSGSDAHWPKSLPMVPGRYHLYVGNACPWCHRATISLSLRGLRGAISVTTLADDPERARRGGWCFDASDPDPLLGASDLKAVYDACTPGDVDYTGRCTAPLLVDLQTATIVSNESADIIRMLNEFNVETGKVVDLYPSELRSDIDATNDWVYEKINNGVYRAGFATTQEAYEDAEKDVHESLARCDGLLSERRFLCGEFVTEADVRLLPTAVRFDGVYASFFRCGRKQLRSDYPHVNRWMKEMLNFTGLGLFDLSKARESYYGNLFPLNPGGIVPAGPTMSDLGISGTAPGDTSGRDLEPGAFMWKLIEDTTVV